MDCERDFGMLHRMMREKPRAYTCTLEGLITYRKNRSNEWLNGMSEEKIQNVCENAQKIVNDSKVVQMRTRAVVGAELSARLDKKRNEKEVKETKQRVRAEDRSDQVSKCGGFWKCKADMDDWLKDCKDESKKRKALEAQMRYRKFVLRSKNANGCLNLTSGGKRVTICDMIENLSISMNDSASDRDDVSAAVVLDFSGVIASDEKVGELKDEYLSKKPVARNARNDGKLVRNMPFVNDVYDLLGKRIEHLCEMTLGRKVSFTVYKKVRLVTCMK